MKNELHFNNEHAHAKEGSLVAIVQQTVDRKVFMEVVNIPPIYGKIINVSKRTWNTMLDIKGYKDDKQYSSVNILNTRPLTIEEREFFQLEEKLPEIEGIFI